MRRPPYFDGMPREPEPVRDIAAARCLVMVGDSVTTDHISPAGVIKPDSPAGKYLIERDKLEMFKSNYDPRPGRKPIRRLL